MSFARQVEHTPPLHEYGSSMPALSPASRMLSLPFSSVNVRVAPSRTTVTSHSVWPGSGGFARLCSCFGMLVAKRSIRIFAFGIAARLQRLGDRLHHAVGAADEHGVDVVEIDPVREQRVGLLAVDAAVQQLDVLRLARQHVDQVEARRGSVSLSAASSSLNITVPDARLP